MAKQFHFDDEDDEIQSSGYQQSSHIDELEELKETSSHKVNTNSYSIEETRQYKVKDTMGYDINEYDEEDDSMKKKKKFIWKWWHYVLIGLTVLFVAFIVYIFVLSSNNGPVYGQSRCQGIMAIEKDNIQSTISDIKKKYPEVQTLTMEIACKQLKVDILFKDGMDTKKAKSIAEETIQILDGLVGKKKDSGKKYSHLFGYENNVAQYEVNLFLESNNSKDFPIYGTKHVQKDSFSYTLASVRDEKSKEKAENTLKDKKIKTGLARFFVEVV